MGKEGYPVVVEKEAEFSCAGDGDGAGLIPAVLCDARLEPSAKAKDRKT